MPDLVDATPLLGFYGLFFGPPVRFGEVITLKHRATGAKLHSHRCDYSHPGGSGQQQVTGFNRGNSDDLWKVLGPHPEPLAYGDGKAVVNGDSVRLRHQTTGRYLHSHGGFVSPATRQQEVTAFGEDGRGDDNDNWVVQLRFGDLWRRRSWLRLVHSNTRAALHSHAGHEIATCWEAQQEVTGFSGRDRNDWWSVS